jgi:hypothetical protein
MSQKLATFETTTVRTSKPKWGYDAVYSHKLPAVGTFHSTQRGWSFSWNRTQTTSYLLEVSWLHTFQTSLWSVPSAGNIPTQILTLSFIPFSSTQEVWLHNVNTQGKTSLLRIHSGVRITAYLLHTYSTQWMTMAAERRELSWDNSGLLYQVNWEKKIYTIYKPLNKIDIFHTEEWWTTRYLHSPCVSGIV